VGVCVAVSVVVAEPDAAELVLGAALADATADTDGTAEALRLAEILSVTLTELVKLPCG
jgi:hypothetical protein